MGKKVLNPLEDPPTASSSSHEQPQQQLSISDEPKDPSPKPLKTPPSTAAAAAPSSGSEKKRASKEANEEHAKRAKMLSQKSPFTRIWNEEDEISLLQGMILFKAQKGISPYEDMNGFFLVTKDSISFDVTKNQIVEKIRHFKNKYYNGKDSRSFSKPHDKECLKWANCIWGSDDGIGMAVIAISKKVDKKKKKKKKKEKLEVADEEMLGSDGMVVVKAKVEEDTEVPILDGDYESSGLFDKSFLVPFIVSEGGVDECSVKHKWSKMPIETKKRVEDELKLVAAKEFELFRQKCDLGKKVASIFTQAI